MNHPKLEETPLATEALDFDVNLGFTDLSWWSAIRLRAAIISAFSRLVSPGTCPLYHLARPRHSPYQGTQGPGGRPRR